MIQISTEPEEWRIYFKNTSAPSDDVLIKSKPTGNYFTFLQIGE